MRPVAEPRTTDICDRQVIERLFLDGVLAAPGDGAQTAGVVRVIVARARPVLPGLGEGLDVAAIT